MKRIAVIIISFIAVSVAATEHWIAPAKYIYKRGETINLRFFSGNDYSGDIWNASRNNLQSLRFYFSNAVDTNLDQSLSEKKGDSLQIADLDDGTAMVTLRSKNIFTEHSSVEFNNYLRDEGLSFALDYRERNKDTTSSGREYYEQDEKTIFQVGNATDNTYKIKTHLPLEIVPGEHPYTVAKDGRFKIKVFFRGNPLKHHLIKVWHKLNNKVTLTSHFTDEQGECKFFLAAEGEWMVGCVEMIRLEDDSRADWQSFHSTLTWGYIK
jgi:uncharacterized GH25 family protein